MTTYRIALNKEETVFLQGETKAATYDDRSEADRIAYMCRAGLHYDAHVVDVQPEPVNSGNEAKLARSLMEACDTISALKQGIAAAWEEIPSRFCHDDDDLADSVRQMAIACDENSGYAKAYEASQAEIETLKRRNTEGDEQVSALQDEIDSLKQQNDARCKSNFDLHQENERLKAENDDATHRVKQLGARVTELANRVVQLEDQIAAKPEPVADAEIRRVLAEMHRRNEMTEPFSTVVPFERKTLTHWYTTFQSMGAEVVTLRESLEQVTKVKDEMEVGRDSAVRVMRVIADDLRQCKESLENVTKERDELGLAVRGLQGKNEELFKERDEARTKLQSREDLINRAWGELPACARGDLADEIRALLNRANDWERRFKDSLRTVDEWKRSDKRNHDRALEAEHKLARLVTSVRLLAAGAEQFAEVEK